MKKILTTVCALALMLMGCTPALAAEAPAPQSDQSRYYPISVEEYTYGPLDELRIDKVYQLSLSDDPRGIPTEDFERGGRRYYLLDMVRRDEVGMDAKSHTETVTMDSDTNKMDAILQKLEAEMEVTTEEGYSGTLRLDHTSVKAEVKGYQTSTQNLSATRTYPNLSEADVSLIPKSITDKGQTLNLADLQWAAVERMDGEGGVVTHYTATDSYTGSVTNRYPTGYTVTADYTGEVVKTDCQMVTYTVTFGSTKAEEAPKESEAPVVDEPGTDAPAPSFDFAKAKKPLMIGGGVLAVGLAAAVVIKKISERR